MTDMHKGRTDLAKANLDIALEEAPKDPLVLDAMGFYLEKAATLMTQMTSSLRRWY